MAGIWNNVQSDLRPFLLVSSSTEVKGQLRKAVDYSYLLKRIRRGCLLVGLLTENDIDELNVRTYGADDIIASLNNDSRNVATGANNFQQKNKG